jgi:hypothetical protein
MKFSAIIASTALAAAAMLPQQVDAHAFLLLPQAQFTIPEKNFYAYVVPGERAPPFSAYITGDAEKNSIGFTANYKKLAPPSLKDFIMKNQEPAKDAKAGGTAECGYSKPDVTPQPLPDHVEFGNYNLQISGGLHPGPCEAWCDDEIVIPFTEDCRTRFQKPIPYAKDKCVGKSRFTFYWLATHFAPFQVYIGCVPLQGAKPGAGGASTPTPSAGNATTPATVKPSPAVTLKPVAPAPAPSPASSAPAATPKPVAPSQAPAPAPGVTPASSAPVASKAPAPAPTPEAAVAPEASPSKCGVKRS